MARRFHEGSVPHQLRVQLTKESKVRHVFPQVPRQRLTAHPIYLYVFSGRRREGDYQFWVERYLHVFNQSGRVLLLDLALSEAHHVGNRDLMDTLMSWMTQGVIAALLVAPPCETWTEARYLSADCDNDPRP